MASRSLSARVSELFRVGRPFPADMEFERSQTPMMSAASSEDPGPSYLPSLVPTRRYRKDKEIWPRGGEETVESEDGEEDGSASSLRSSSSLKVEARDSDGEADKALKSKDSEISQLQEALKAKDAETTRLRQELESQKSTIADMKEQHWKEVSHMHAQLSAMTKELVDTKKNIAKELADAKTELEEKAKAQASTQAQAIEDLAAAKMKAADKTKELEKIHAEKAKLAEELGSMTVECSELREAMQGVQMILNRTSLSRRSGTEGQQTRQVLLIGDSGVGKTSLVDRLCDHRYLNPRTATVDMNYKTAILDLDGERLKVQVWDTSGQERFHSIATSYYRHAMGVVLAYDVTNVESFSRIRAWQSNVERYATNGVDRILVGCKCDAYTKRVVTKEEGQKLADELGVTFVETSAQHNEGIEEAFAVIVRKIKARLFDATNPDFPPECKHLPQQTVTYSNGMGSQLANSAENRVTGAGNIATRTTVDFNTRQLQEQIDNLEKTLASVKEQHVKEVQHLHEQITNMGKELADTKKSHARESMDAQTELERKTKELSSVSVQNMHLRGALQALRGYCDRTLGSLTSGFSEIAVGAARTMYDPNAMVSTPQELGTLIIVVLKAKDLPNTKTIGRQETYCVVSFDGQHRFTKTAKRSGQHPEWDEEIRFVLYEDLDLPRTEEGSVKEQEESILLSSVPAKSQPSKEERRPTKPRIKGGDHIVLECYADGGTRKPEGILIGQTVIDLTQAVTTGETDEWFTLTNQGRYSGEVYLELTFWTSTPPEDKASVLPGIGGEQIIRFPHSLSLFRLKSEDLPMDVVAPATALTAVVEAVASSTSALQPTESSSHEITSKLDDAKDEKDNADTLRNKITELETLVADMKVQHVKEVTHLHEQITNIAKELAGTHFGKTKELNDAKAEIEKQTKVFAKEREKEMQELAAAKAEVAKQEKEIAAAMTTQVAELLDAKDKVVKKTEELTAMKAQNAALKKALRAMQMLCMQTAISFGLDNEADSEVSDLDLGASGSSDFVLLKHHFNRHPWRPQEDEATLNLERNFLAGDLVCGVGYGIQLVLYISCASYLWKHRKGSRNKLFLLAYITLLLVIETIFVIVQGRTVQVVYIENRDYPGGPWQYFLDTQNLAINVMFYATFFVLTFLNDLLVLWRCWVIWASSGRLVAGFVIFFPALATLASFAMGTLWTLQSSQPTLSMYSALPMAYGTSYYTISVSINIILTILIITRLLIYRRGIMQSLPADFASQYVSLTAIVVESAALYSVFAIMFLITYAMNDPTNQVFLGFASACQQIATYLIIYRVAEGKAFGTDPMSGATLTTVVDINGRGMLTSAFGVTSRRTAELGDFSTDPKFGINMQDLEAGQAGSEIPKERTYESSSPKQ
ncbi:hypothetical protein EIP91_004169 [Steccherinum ochraceum]|uniref:C2 domain-containing protein n=1 Tax=Steccherinum ochraceum TaxID=92696 RepID=A0A4R0S010_9APHY|nr:hypothetical protein EIP91_004169 [Steccherinum ochraceum]